jgi:hypothetical protein
MQDLQQGSSDGVCRLRCELLCSGLLCTSILRHSESSSAHISLSDSSVHTSGSVYAPVVDGKQSINSTVSSASTVSSVISIIAK